MKPSQFLERMWPVSVLGLVFFAGSLSRPAVAQTPEWVVRYNGPQGSGQDYGQDVAVDSAGNVYVTGRSEGSGTSDDYATAKYNADGVLQWAARYNGPYGGASDQGWAIALDAAGNAYVTGNSVGNNGTYDVATIRYNTSGGQAWASRYSGPPNSDDGGRDVEIGADGSVNVTGLSVGSGTDYDYVTLKYSAAGGELWSTRYNGPSGNQSDRGAAVAVDAAGNVYVTGESRNSSNNDFATIKYGAANGNEMWADRYNGPSNLDDNARAIAVDGAGNVYVTGFSNDSASQNDYATIKYDTNGSRQWVDRFNGIGGGPDEAYAVAVDAAGNVYVTGGSAGGGGRDYATIKYDLSGSRQWVAIYDGPGNHNDTAADIGVDQVGNVFIAGYSWGGVDMGYDYATIKYNSSGSEQWVARYDGPGTTIATDTGQVHDYATALALSATGTVYVTGYSYGGGNTGNGTYYDYATIKYFECTSISPDCNSNGMADSCDISGGASEDCNTNANPDECDIAAGTSSDCDQNGAADECEGAAGIVQWVGASGGSWNSPANWNGGLVPSGGAFALLYNNAAVENRCRLTTPGSTNVCSLTVTALGPGRQILDVATGSTLRSAGGVDLGLGGDIVLAGGELAGGTVVNTSDSLTGYGTLSASLDNQGNTFATEGRLLVFSGDNFDNRANGLVRALGGSIILLESGAIFQGGEIEIQALAGMFCQQPFTNSAGGVIRLLDGVLGARGVTNETSGSIFGFGAINTDLTNDGEMVTIADTSVLGDLVNDGTITIQNGIFNITGGLSGSGTIIGAFGSRDGPVGGLAVQGDYGLDAGASLAITRGIVKLAGACDVAIDDSARFDLTTSMLQLTGLPADGIQTLEVMGEDLGCNGASLPDASLYSLKTLRIGPTLVLVRLVDDRDNSTGMGPEAMYVQELILHPGTTLDLAGLSMYYDSVTPANAGSPGSGVQVVDSVGGGRLCRLAPPGRGDFTGNNGVDAADVPFFVQVLLGHDMDPLHVVTADVNYDGRADGTDISPFVGLLLQP